MAKTKVPEELQDVESLLRITKGSMWKVFGIIGSIILALTVSLPTYLIAQSEDKADIKYVHKVDLVQLQTDIASLKTSVGMQTETLTRIENKLNSVEK